jgi:hypothetical protein
MTQWSLKTPVSHSLMTDGMSPLKYSDTDPHTNTTMHEQIHLKIKAQEEGWRFHQNNIPCERNAPSDRLLNVMGSIATEPNRTLSCTVPCPF